MMSSRGYAMTNSNFLYNPSIPVFQPNGTPTTTRQGLNAIGLTQEPTFNMWAPIFPEPDVYGRYYGFSPDSYEKFISQAADLEYLLKIGKNIVWQTNLNWAFDDQPGLRSNNGDQEPMVDGRVRFRFQGFRNHRNSYNAKNKLTWRFNLGPTNHTLQAGFDYQEVVTRRPGTLINNTFNSSLVSAFKIYNPKTDGPVSGHAEMAATPGQVYVMWSKQHEYNRGTYIVNQSHFFSDRLHLLYGIRENKLRNSTTVFDRPVTNSPGDARPRPSGWTPQTGILFQPRPDLSVFVVRSQTIEPQFQIDADGQTADPRETEGIDVGFKTAFLDGRVSSTVTYYVLEKSNLTARDTARELETGLSPYYIYGNSQTSRGIEADLNLSLRDNYQVVLGWSHIFYAKVTESTDPTRIGRALGWTPLDKVTLWQRYQFKTGPAALKGVALGLGMNYTAGARINGDPNIALRTEPYVVFDFMASRNFTLRERAIKAQLNVKNLADKTYRTGSLGMFAPERSFVLSFSTRL
jgi:iron complex outermembrane receptor protein